MIAWVAMAVAAAVLADADSFDFDSTNEFTTSDPPPSRSNTIAIVVLLVAMFAVLSTGVVIWLCHRRRKRPEGADLEEIMLTAKDSDPEF